MSTNTADRAAESTRHADQSMPYEWAAYELGDETVVAHTREGTEQAAYRVAGTTRNVRTIAAADAILYEGDLHTPYVDGTRLEIQHFMAGIRERFRAEQWLDEPVVLLEKLDRGDVTEAIDG